MWLRNTSMSILEKANLVNSTIKLTWLTLHYLMTVHFWQKQILLLASKDNPATAAESLEPDGQRPLQRQIPVENGNIVQEAKHNLQMQQAIKRTRRGISRTYMDNELTIIPGHIYQSWLQNSSDISCRKKKKWWQKNNQISPKRIGHLMELPPVAMISGFKNTAGEVYYPTNLMEQWAKRTLQVPGHDSSSLPKSPRRSAELLPSSLLRRRVEDPPEFPVEDFQSGVGSHEQEFSIEKLRANLENIEQIAVEDALKRGQFSTPGSLENSAGSIPSSGSGHDSLPYDPEVQLTSGRSKRTQHSSSRHSLGNLDPVEEEIPWEQNGRDHKLRRLSENGPTPDFELLEETMPTQTPMPEKAPIMDELTRSIQTQLKVHFDTPGAPQVESLNELAFGMTRRKAAQLFYQTCILASTDYLRVEQKFAFGEISISKGPKMQQE